MEINRIRFNVVRDVYNLAGPKVINFKKWNKLPKVFQKKEEKDEKLYKSSLKRRNKK